VRYVPELDGLRALAVVAVVLFHAAPDGPVRGGFVGVDLFFVLSAFLITTILAGRPELKLFYWRRACRLVPALLLMLAVYLLAAPFVWPNYPHGRDASITALYLSDYSYTFWHVPLYLRHTWSLAVEEHFYLLWPLLLFPLLRARNAKFILLGAYVAATAWRMSFDGWLSYYYRFDTHLTGLILGAWLALERPTLPKWAGAIAAASLGLILVVGDIRRASDVIPFAEMAGAVLIVSPPTIFAQRALVWIGKRSYAIYLWHFPIALVTRGSLDSVSSTIVTLVLSIGAAAVSFITVEAWGRRLRDGVEARRSVEV
jgi:peptidoglycan/LPS O-acetylase OafA/YrhL